MKFILTYRNGGQELVETDAETCEDQSNRSFGLTLEEAQDFGANVEFYKEPEGEPTEAELQGLAEGSAQAQANAQEHQQQEQQSEADDSSAAAQFVVETHAPELTQTTDAQPQEQAS